jgi:hypothetical protein
VAVQAGMYSYYKVGGNCTTTLAPGASCQATVVYTPPYAQRQPDAVAVQHDGFIIDIPTYIYGVGISTTVSVTPTAMSFRAADQQASAPQIITITNTGSQPLVVGAQVGGIGFSQQSSTCGQAVAPGQSCAVAIQYTGDAAAFSSSGQVMISGDFPNSPILVPLTGWLLSGHVVVTPVSLSFGPQTVYTSSASQRVTLTNGGSSPTYFASIPGSSNFGWTSTCPSYSTGLAAGQSCTFDVTFVPTTTGNLQDTLQIPTSADNTPTIVPLSGAAKSGFLLPTGAGSSQTIKSGQQAAYPLSYAFSGNGGTIQFTCSGVPSATCSIAPQSTTQASGTLPLTVSVSTQTYTISLWRSRGETWALGSFVALGMVLMTPRRRRVRLIFGLLLMAVAVSIVSCGGGGGNSGGGGGGGGQPHGTPPGTYTVNVQAQGPGFADSYQLQLTVQ